MTMNMSLKMEKKRSQRDNTNRPRPRHGHKYTKYKMYFSIKKIFMTSFYGGVQLSQGCRATTRGQSTFYH